MDLRPYPAVRMVALLLAMVVASLTAPAAAKAQPEAITIQACSTLNGVSLDRVQWAFGQIDYHYSRLLTTTGCNSNYTIKVSTSVLPSGTGECAKLRVRLFPSSGGSIVPRSPVYVCPGAGYIELANYIIAGTSYQVESTNGYVSSINVQH